ncbi:hypothetical protein KUV50_16820 [Membranicola marinus]|uniref:Uncharacterized protein n=1 Tax=Membranihabitans marinus TaxID=1227546 RepID=A0A953LEC8_9BACT|nr:hypothetical protein [Membranihabitans marinus]MBY5959819.1 hypothetical protein [Membranihabitans marinus]
MFKSEPKSIVRFLATHFDLIRHLFDIQIHEGVITRQQVSDALSDWDSDVEDQLLEYRILTPQNDDFLISEPYFVLLEFILQQFKPLLPEEIDIYGQSIRTLFLQIREGIHLDRNILLERMDALANQIKKFTTAIRNNTTSLQHESRELKANTQNMEYEEKIRKARHLIEFYIMPLNTILDVNHSQSIYNELLHISQYVNKMRFNYENESIRRRFGKLYNLLVQSNTDISSQSAIISNELLPLIERIRTESEYLQGFHIYLTNGDCYKKYDPPALFSISRTYPYQHFVYENTKQYFEQFRHEESVYIEEAGAPEEQWIFDQEEYRQRLESQLPVDDFFSWCGSAISEDKPHFRLDEYFMITSLIFEDDYEIESHHPATNAILKSDDVQLVLPRLKIKKKHVSEKP